MNVNNGDGVRDITRAQWDALLARCEIARAENARVRDQALQAKSDAVEQRRRSEAGRLERDKAAF